MSAPWLAHPHAIPRPARLPVPRLSGRRIRVFTHALVWADIVADFTDQRPDDSTPQLCAQAALDTLPLGSQHLASGVELAQIDGAGRGLVTTRPLPPGELILACQPLALVTGAPGLTLQPPRLTQPLTDTVLQHGVTPITSNAPSADFAWLQSFWLLHGGRLGPTPPPPQLIACIASLQQKDLTDVLGIMLSARPLSAPQTTPAPTSQQGKVTAGLRDAVRRAAASRAQYNAYGETHQDVVAQSLLSATAAARSTAARSTHQDVVAQTPMTTAARSTEPTQGDNSTTKGSTGQQHQSVYRSCIGLWPGFALINHSCAPNASTLVCGETMVVRAAREIEAGEEISITYAGAQATSPLSVRRGSLQDAYGFMCECGRCLVEQDYEGEEMGRVAEALYVELSSDLRPRLLSALDTGDMVGVVKVQAKLLQLRSQYLAALSAVEDQDDLSILQCATLPLCLELLSMADTALATHLAATQESSRASKARTAPRRQAKGFARQPPGQQSKGGGVGVLGDRVKQRTWEERYADTRVRLDVLRTVAPGSYAEADLSARALLSCWRSLGPGHDDTRTAFERCLAAHTARYGRELCSDADTLVAMLNAHETNSLADDMARALAEAESATA